MLALSKRREVKLLNEINPRCVCMDLCRMSCQSMKKIAGVCYANVVCAF